MTVFPGFRGAGSPGAERRERRHGQARAARPGGDRRRFLRMGESRRFAAGAVPSSGVGSRGGIRRLVFARRRRQRRQFAAPELEIAPDPIAAGAAAGGFISGAAAQPFSNTTLSPFGMVDSAPAIRRQLVSRRRNARISRPRPPPVPIRVTDPAGGPAQYADPYRADVASIVGLVNGYVNLGAWYGFSPFLGAGVGFADNRLSGFTDQGPGFGDIRRSAPLATPTDRGRASRGPRWPASISTSRRT